MNQTNILLCQKVVRKDVPAQVQEVAPNHPGAAAAEKKPHVNEVPAKEEKVQANQANALVKGENHRAN